MEQSSAIEKEKGRVGGIPIAAEKILEIDDAGYVLAFCGFFKSRSVVSTDKRDDNEPSYRIRF